MRVRSHHKIEEARSNYLPLVRRSLSFSDFEIDTRSANLDKRIVEGYGNMWNVRNSHGEKIVKGAWTRSIKENGPGSNANYKIKLRDNHGRGMSLFETLEQDSEGLYFKSLPLDKVSWADDALTQIRSGTINNFSNGFRPMWDRVEWDDEDDSLVISEGRLFEISTAYIPSDMETYAKRNAEQLVAERNELEIITEDFIESLPTKHKVKARQLITRHIELSKLHLEDTEREMQVDKLKKKGIDYDYLLKHL